MYLNRRIRTLLHNSCDFSERFVRSLYSRIRRFALLWFDVHFSSRVYSVVLGLHRIQGWDAEFTAKFTSIYRRTEEAEYLFKCSAWSVLVSSSKTDITKNVLHEGPFFLEMYVRMKDLHEQLSKHFEAWEAKNSAFVWRDAFVKEYHSG